jgi:hypothetical protein
MWGYAVGACTRTAPAAKKIRADAHVPAVNARTVAGAKR